MTKADDKREADENFERYIDLLGRIYQRIKADPEAYQAFKRGLVEEKKRQADMEPGQDKGSGTSGTSPNQSPPEKAA